MKKIVVLALCMICSNIFAQDNKLLIGASFSPDYSYRHLSANSKNSDSFAKELIAARNEAEAPLLGFNSGLKLIYKIKPKWALETGIGISKKGERFKEMEILVTDPNDPLAGDKIKNRFSYYYLEVPIKANYYLTTGKLKLFASAGLSADLFLFGKNKAIITFSDGHKDIYNTTSTSNGNSFALGVQGGFGVEYSLSNKFDMRIEPTYRRQILTTGNQIIKVQYYSAGLTVGVYYKL